MSSKETISRLVSEKYADQPETVALVLEKLNMDGSPVDELKLRMIASFVAATVKTCEDLGMDMSPSATQLLVTLKIMLDSYEDERAKLCPNPSSNKPE